MVTYGDVGRRHVIYGVALLQVILFAEYTLFLTALLLVDMGLVCWHMNTPYAFTGIAMSCTPVAASLCVTLSHHTWYVSTFQTLPGNCERADGSVLLLQVVRPWHEHHRHPLVALPSARAICALGIGRLLAGHANRRS